MFEKTNKINVSGETNTLITENQKYSEFSSAKEFAPITENKRIFEINDETKKIITKKKRKAFQWQHFLVSATTVAAVTVIGVGGIVQTPNISIVRYYIGTSPYSMFYEIVLDGYKSGDNVTLEIYNDFFRCSELVSDNFAAGQIGDLKENMTYTLELKQGTQVLLKKNIITREGEIYEYYNDKYDPDYNPYEEDYSPNDPTVG